MESSLSVLKPDHSAPEIEQKDYAQLSELLATYEDVFLGYHAQMFKKVNTSRPTEHSVAMRAMLKMQDYQGTEDELRAEAMILADSRYNTATKEFDRVHCEFHRSLSSNSSAMTSGNIYRARRVLIAHLESAIELTKEFTDAIC